MLENVLSAFNESVQLEIRSELCGHSYSTRFSCRNCTDHCPVQGLTWKDKGWDLADCNRCGKCVAVCPSHVFKLDEEKLIKNSQSPQAMILSCSVLQAELPESWQQAVTPVACLHQLYPELLINLSAQDAGLYIYLDTARCDQCQGFKLVQLLEQIDAFGAFSRRIIWIQQREELKLLLEARTVNAISRRDFLGTVFRRGKKATLGIINEKIADYSLLLDNGPAPTKADQAVQAEKRTKLLRAGELFAASQPMDNAGLLPYRHLQVDKCEFCGICTQLCPGRALMIESLGNRKYLRFWPYKCSGCGLCQAVCIKGQLVWGNSMGFDEFFSRQALTLAVAEMNRCQLCGADLYFYPKQPAGVCAECSQSRNVSPFKRWKYDSA